MPENPERQINPHPNVTIRQSRNAMHILITGAMRSIEQASPNPESVPIFARLLIDNLMEEIAAWDVAS